MTELIKSQGELEAIADFLTSDISSPNTVSRFMRVVHDSVTFINGTSSMQHIAQTNLNRERMTEGIYTFGGVDDLFPHNFREVGVARDLEEHRFSFHKKDIPLSRDRIVRFEPIPTGINHYDAEFREFTRAHPNTRLTRDFIVEQRVIVNSDGGRAIQSIPFFSIRFSHGYDPIPINRDISVVCNTHDDIRSVQYLVECIADPTPEGRVRKSKTFSAAFGELVKTSPLRYGTLEDAGIPISELYDVVMITGTPVHEIFGHHFEEPIRYLSYGESGTFKQDQNIRNTSLQIMDDPTVALNGLRVQGFTHFDAYGRKREPRIHVQNGKVTGFLGSEYADPVKLKQFMNIQDSPYIGNAGQHVDGLFPQPRMSCSVLNGPTQDVELEGKIILVSHEGRTNPSDKTYMVNASEAYVIRNAEPHRIIPVQVTGGINQALANIVLMPNDSYQVGMCGKGEPIYMRVSAQMPVSMYCKDQLWQGQQVYPLPISDKHLRVLIKRE